MAGAVIPAALVTGIQSDLPGDVIATVTEPVYDTATGRFLLIPEGSRILGKYNSQVSYGQCRVQMVWNRIILPDTSSLTLDNLVGTDPAGNSGLEDGVDLHWGRLLDGAALTTMLGVGAELAALENRTDGNRIVIAGARKRPGQHQSNQAGTDAAKPGRAADTHRAAGIAGARDRESRSGAAALPADVHPTGSYTMSAPKKLRLGPLPKTESVKLIFACPASLKADLDRYAALHAQAYGEAVDAMTLIPHMLMAFMARDRGFKRTAADRMLVGPHGQEASTNVTKLKVCRYHPVKKSHLHSANAARRDHAQVLTRSALRPAPVPIHQARIAGERERPWLSNCVRLPTVMTVWSCGRRRKSPIASASPSGVSVNVPVASSGSCCTIGWGSRASR